MTDRPRKEREGDLFELDMKFRRQDGSRNEDHF